MQIPSPKLSFRRRSGSDLVGLDIQPGFVAAVQARSNGAVVAEQAASVPLAADVVRDGEVSDERALVEALRELFVGSGLSKRVRVGVANQRTVLRTLELPPLTDRKELAAAVSFQAQEQVPMPLSNAVLDFHPLGIIDTPAGPRQRVVLVAAQRDMIERLLGAVRGAGLRPEGIDLSAFALIRSLYRANAEGPARVLYLNVDGLTNLAIAEGHICRFTRVVGSGLEGMAGQVAERRGIAISEARALLGAVDLSVDAEPEAPASAGPPVEEVSPEQEPALEADPPADTEAHEAEPDSGFSEFAAIGEASTPRAPEPFSDADVRQVLESGIRDIAGEVRNSLDFHRSQEGGGEVGQVLLSGCALELPGFVEMLHSHLHVDVQAQTVSAVEQGLGDAVSIQRLAVATGLAASEVHA